MDSLRFTVIFFLVAVYGLLLSCASTGKLSGGPKDEKPPRVSPSKSSTNHRVNHRPDKIKLTFDEWVIIKDVYKEVIISPPMQVNPSITSRGKQVTVDFSGCDSLRNDATYVINFGQAIRDFREGNILENYQFVFSTGPVIDSLSLLGRVVDAFDGTPEEGALVMLYDNLSDSAFYKERPFYFARTNEEGQFKLHYLKSDTFQMVALFNDNLNYRFDGGNEEVAFLDTTIIVNDSLFQFFELELFANPSILKVSAVDLKYDNLANITLNEPSDDVPYNVTGLTGYKTAIVRDTIKVWYDEMIDTSFKVEFGFDTIEVRNDKIPRKTSPLSFQLISNNGGFGGPLFAGGKLQLVFSTPISEVDTSFIEMKDTSGQLIPINISLDEDDVRGLLVDGSFLTNEPYTITLYPGSVTDFLGNSLDTLTREIKIADPLNFGIIHLSIDSLMTDDQYIVLIKNSVHPVFTNIVIGQSSFSQDFINVKPGTYTLSVILDSNGNEKWDTGNYDKRSQAEDIYRVQLEPLRANWELDVNLNFTELKQ